MSIGRMMASVLTYHLRLADGDKHPIGLRWFKPWLKQLGMKNLSWWALVARLRWKWFGICPAMPTLQTSQNAIDRSRSVGQSPCMSRFAIGRRPRFANALRSL
ncbi:MULTISPECIES: hypothetical protein [Moorena]|uniref:Uncharacterized protein n=3 Tax=Coleofasciculaceae TaxID=1892251 RepID=A0A1D9G791_MOOP1|nr:MULTISPECIES: hypothetical protein [Moorena]NEQ14113.1 hypothetical protein [Moorena sp. SIO3E2]AOY83270.2 hypothetical protein BJP36_28450 [Moorena producens JHB]NEP31129.1 hypothetical protein [Moorena sp. SIO3B2]NEQ07157.1 hypothetical protein [Moorena sp. SIO4E2]NER86265.1 hypothetical protein [Moorena sp. SIO3A2]